MENKLPQRKSTRYKDFDYSTDGYYFITICIKERREFFGKIINSQMVLNQRGKIANECWIDLPNHYHNCELDYYVIMPDHIHGVVIIDNSKPGVKRHSLSEIMRGFKTFSSKRINDLTKFSWQKSFYDRIIRNEKELNAIRKYIEQNPLKWEIEHELPENIFM